LHDRRFANQLNSWTIETKYSETALAHEANLEEWRKPTIWIIEPKDSCLVLGKSQRGRPFLDLGYLKEQSINLAARQSGGGAVLVSPEDMLWVDVFVPKESKFWIADIAEASIWIGGIWRNALKRLDIECFLFDEKFSRSEASDLICFLGRAPGELFIDNRKILGISQRRSKFGTRFQCALIINWKPEHMVAAYSGAPIPNLDKLISYAGISSGCEKHSALDAFLSALPSL
tara:strand:+ start:154 stop:846 length:693 start_codon:yes stop_codon:yes gene_type:complete